MARKTKQQARETRQLILDVALRLFSQQGVSSTSLATIAKAAGNDSNLLIVFYVQIVPDDFVMQLHRF